MSAVLPRATACKNKGIKFLTKPLEKKKLHQVTLRKNKQGHFALCTSHLIPGWVVKKWQKGNICVGTEKKGAK